MDTIYLMRICAVDIRLDYNCLLWCREDCSLTSLPLMYRERSRCPLLVVDPERRLLSLWIARYYCSRTIGRRLATPALNLAARVPAWEEILKGKSDPPAGHLPPNIPAPSTAVYGSGLDQTVSCRPYPAKTGSP